MKRNLIIICLISFSISLSGQINRYGVPIIRNYPTQMTGGSEQNWCITKDKSGNLYFGNQERGVIRYDGTKWTSITIGEKPGKNPRVNSLEADTAGIIYVGAAFEFGYIQPDEKGIPEYVSLASRIDSLSEIGMINDIVIGENKVLFLSPKFIIAYETDIDSVYKINLKQFNLVRTLRLVMINNRIIISDNNEGLFELKGNTVAPLPNGDFFRTKICTFILPFNNNRILIGTFNDGLFLYDLISGDVNTAFIDEKINENLKDVMVYAGSRMGNDLFAIGTTVKEGILIFNKDGELIQQINNENSGLEDITIYSLFCDYENNSELWISTQGIISKAYFNYPLTQFSEKHGIETVINDICELNGSLYLSSDAGVLKGYVSEKNTMHFRGIPGAAAQVFPLSIIKNPAGDFLMAGSINGLLQISGNRVLNVEDAIYNLPGDQPKRYNVRKILQSDIDPSVIFLGLEFGRGITIVKNEGNKWRYVNTLKNIPGNLTGIVEKKEGGLWFITEDQNALYGVNFQGNDTIISKYGPEKGLNGVDVNSIHFIEDQLFVTSTSGILRYNQSNDSFTLDNSITDGFSDGKNLSNLYNDAEGDLWLSIRDDKHYEMLFSKDGNVVSGIMKLLPDATLMDIMYSDGKVYILKSRFLYVVDKSLLTKDTTKVKTYFARITVGSDSVLMEGTFYKTGEGNKRIPVDFNPSREIPEFIYDMNQISFECTTPSYTEELLTEYSYILEGYDKEWSEWEGISFGNTLEAQYFKHEYKNLPFGDYVFRVKTRTLTGLTGDELTFRFTILKPWYATIFAIIGFIIITFLIIYLIIKAYTRKLKNENQRLEGIVADRTAVVVKQKEELESSIHYASRIQMALLPSEAILSENIRNYFVLFKPRDIVSGDFYWMTKKNDRLYIVGADCTGHGVPGAFMSLLGMSFLDEIIDKDRAFRADEILRELRIHVIESLKQVGNANEAKDGMDIALLVVDFKTNRIEFSGAYNPCFRVRKLTDQESKKWDSDLSESGDGTMTNGKYLLDTIYASKMPIGISSRMNDDFVFHDWPLEKGISYYLFSDGYVDQFGGPDGRKFMKKNFKRLLLDIQDYPMEKQKEFLEKNLNDWMGESPQIDDILVMGVRI